MNEQALRAWQALHQRSVIGQPLSDAERASYEAGCQELDDEENLDGDLAELRALRGLIAETKTEKQKLRERGLELEARIAAAEAALNDRARLLLGIGT